MTEHPKPSYEQLEQYLIKARTLASNRKRALQQLNKKFQETQLALSNQRWKTMMFKKWYENAERDLNTLLKAVEQPKSSPWYKFW